MEVLDIALAAARIPSGSPVKGIAALDLAADEAPPGSPDLATMGGLSGSPAEGVAALDLAVTGVAVATLGGAASGSGEAGPSYAPGSRSGSGSGASGLGTAAPSAGPAGKAAVDKRLAARVQLNREDKLVEAQLQAEGCCIGKGGG